MFVRLLGCSTTVFDNFWGKLKFWTYKNIWSENIVFQFLEGKKRLFGDILVYTYDFWRWKRDHSASKCFKGFLWHFNNWRLSGFLLKHVIWKVLGVQFSSNLGNYIAILYPAARVFAFFSKVKILKIGVLWPYKCVNVISTT
jgi:hypothetical protein